ncbi:Retrovirus-related Pol polyprotein from transposon TNT 1-94 [Euphorbia peplus]|nr:Retrovirus-related Pol polyprotein from transposon TNT 1-94 [Euphorbia peplus]
MESIFGTSSSHGYRKTYTDPCVYFKRFSGNNFIILLLYVDDMLIVGQDALLIRKLKEQLLESFDMKDLGPAQQILGMRIVRDRNTKKLWLSQEKYVERVLERFNMVNAKPVSITLAGHMKLSKESCPTTKEEKEAMRSIPYSSAVGSLMYAMVCTRPDIAHDVGVVSRFLDNPGRQHWEAVKWILRYLKGSPKVCLCYGGSKPILEGFVDADMAGDLDHRRSTSGYVFRFARGAISWQSKLQKCIALSTTEAEYISAAEAGKEMIWLKRFFEELGQKQAECIVYCDSQSAIDLSKNTIYHSRTKHIGIRYHWIRDQLENGVFHLEKIATERNLSDMLTKVIPREKFELCNKLIGMSSH